jgi:ABC-type uncharacterized transport system permease subunit
MSSLAPAISGIAIGLVGGAVRGSIPYMFVSLGECLTEKSGRINLGMEGVLLIGAMTAFGISDRSGSPWLGVIAAALAGAFLGLVHSGLTELPRVNDVAAGIAMIIFGSGLAFFFGKQFIAPMAPQLPVMEFGGWSANPAVRSALRISPLFFLGVAIALALHYALATTRWGLHVRAVGDAPDAARSMGLSVSRHRAVATVVYFPGIWSEGISGGQGLMAVALVIFARWNPLRCLLASLLFGGSQALGPSLQSAGISSFYHLFNASPYVLTFIVMIASCTRKQTLAGMPGALAKRS